MRHADVTLLVANKSRLWVTAGSFTIGGWCPACSNRGRQNGGEFGQTSALSPFSNIKECVDNF